MKESPIFVKAFDLLVWTLERTRKFPKDQRFVMARRLEEAMLDLYDRLIEAGRVKAHRAMALGEADLTLERLKVYGRLCERLRLITPAQYEFLSTGLGEVGRLLGAWMKTASTGAVGS